MATKERRQAKWGDASLDIKEVHERKKRSLVASAGRVFREKGYQDASMDDIANDLNVSKTAIYYYVRNKSELLYLCHSLAFDLGDEAMNTAKAEGKTGADKIRILIKTYVTSLTSELGGGALMTSDSALEPHYLEEVRKRRRAWDKGFRAIMDEGIKDGSIGPCDTRLIEFFIMGAIRGLHRWFSPDGEKTGEEIADQLLAMVFDGIGGK